MAVLGVHGIVLQVPDLAEGRRFYCDAGLQAREVSGRLHFRCPGQDRDAIVLVNGEGPKRLHHIALAADLSCSAELQGRILAHGGTIIAAPDGFIDEGVWLRDPHDMVVHLIDSPRELVPDVVNPFRINQPGQLVRTNQSAMLRKAATARPVPARLGHMALFTPNLDASIEFFDQALGMGLADRAQEVIAFMCSRRGSDHHVVAFVQSKGLGLHHASFQMLTPDDAGIAGDRLFAVSQRGRWGFGRHTIGSNFFYYIQDPWGSWFEYYCDIDYVADYSTWVPTNYGLEDSLHNWGPDLPEDFVINYEADPAGYVNRAEGAE